MLNSSTDLSLGTGDFEHFVKGIDHLVKTVLILYLGESGMVYNVGMFSFYVMSKETLPDVQGLVI